MTAPFVGKMLKGVVIQYLPLFGEFWWAKSSHFKRNSLSQVNFVMSPVAAVTNKKMLCLKVTYV